MHKLLFRISLIKFTAAKLVVDTLKTFEYRINTFHFGRNRARRYNSKTDFGFLRRR